MDLHTGVPSDSSASVPGKPEVNRKRFPKASIKVLKRWFLTNAHDPHPTDVQKRLLCEQTGLSVTQVSNWFANARRRGIRESAAQGLSSVSVPSLNHATDWNSLGPLERWRNSPPAEEPASMTAIADAVAQRDHTTTVQNYIHRPGTPFVGSRNTRPLSETSFESLSSFWTSDSSSSAQSERSDSVALPLSHSIENLSANGRRRRRRSASRYHVSARKLQNTDQLRIYQCTFCTDTFKTRFDWMRHESTLHLVLETWVCTPEGPTYLDQVQDLPRCALCDEANPDEDHLKSHSYYDCSAKPARNRTFHRKDHLRQHLRLIHGIKTPPLTMNQWRNTIKDIESRCGFCNEHFTLWPSRMEHIGDHFQEGAKMKDWKGDRGFKPEIALLVENAMPPYMIGSEAKTLVPFSASRNLQVANAERDGRGSTERTMFQVFTAKLAESVSESLRDGILVTDESVRKRARLIMFGDDDAWNQTPADNDEWLRIFKNGLSSGRFRSTNLSRTEGSVEQNSLSAAQFQVIPANLWAEVAELSSDSYGAEQSTTTQSLMPDMALPMLETNNDLDTSMTWMSKPNDHTEGNRPFQHSNDPNSNLDIEFYLQSLATDPTSDGGGMDHLTRQQLGEASRGSFDAELLEPNVQAYTVDNMTNALITPDDHFMFTADSEFRFDLDIEDSAQPQGYEGAAASCGTRRDAV